MYLTNSKSNSSSMYKYILFYFYLNNFSKSTERTSFFNPQKEKVGIIVVHNCKKLLFADSIPGIDQNPPLPSLFALHDREICRWPPNKKENQGLKK